MFRWKTLLKIAAVIFTLGSLMVLLASSNPNIREPVLRSAASLEETINVRMLEAETDSIKSTNGSDKDSGVIIINAVDSADAATEDIMDYLDLGQCRKPTFIPNLKASCWFECQDAAWCSNTTDYGEWKLMVQEKRAQRFCFPNQHLLGVQRSGTADLLKWFSLLSSQYQVTHNELPLKHSDRCPLATFKKFTQNSGEFEENNWLNSDPDAMFRYSIRSWAHEKVKVLSSLQFLGFLNEPRSRYVVTMRNPTDMFISYLHQAYRHGWIYKGIMPAQFTPVFKQVVVDECIAGLQDCLKIRSEQKCVLAVEFAKKSNLAAVLRHGVYFQHIKEMFKFIPRDQIYFSMLEEYSTAQGNFSQAMLDLFGEKIVWSPKAITASSNRHNCGKSQPSTVLPVTIQALDKFYKPYNERLAKLLDDQKWLFKRNAFDKVSAKCS